MQARTAPASKILQQWKECQGCGKLPVPKIKAKTQVCRLPLLCLDHWAGLKPDLLVWATASEFTTKTTSSGPVVVSCWLRYNVLKAQLPQPSRRGVLKTRKITTASSLRRKQGWALQHRAAPGQHVLRQNNCSDQLSTLLFTRHRVFPTSPFQHRTEETSQRMPLRSLQAGQILQQCHTDY